MFHVCFIVCHVLCVTFMIMLKVCDPLSYVCFAVCHVQCVTIMIMISNMHKVISDAPALVNRFASSH